MGILVSHDRTLHKFSIYEKYTESTPRKVLAAPCFGKRSRVRMWNTAYRRLNGLHGSARHIAGHRQVKIHLGTLPRQIAADELVAVESADGSVF